MSKTLYFISIIFRKIAINNVINLMKICFSKLIKRKHRVQKNCVTSIFIIANTPLTLADFKSIITVFMQIPCMYVVCIVCYFLFFKSKSKSVTICKSSGLAFFVASNKTFSSLFSKISCAIFLVSSLR